MKNKDTAAMITACDAAAGVTIINVMMSVNAVRPHPKNARVHPQRQIDELAKAFKVFGFTVPLVVDERNVVLSGHGRLAAALVAGIEAIPVRQIIGLSEELKRAYVIADNKIALDAKWDDTALLTELKDLHELGVLDHTGFDKIDLKQLASPFEPQRIEDASRITFRVSGPASRADELRNVLELALTAAGIADVEID
jgi:hypothetical protein